MLTAVIISFPIILKFVWDKIVARNDLSLETIANKMKISSVENADLDESEIPLSVNYLFTRKCNYECKFCFHQAKTLFHLPIEEAKRGIRMLVEAG